MHKRLDRIAGMFFLIFIFLIVPSCSSKNRLAGHVYYRLNADPTTLDPALIVDVTGGSISAKIFNGLVKLDEQLNVVPDIAESWEILDEGTTYIFHLKKHVNFSNNREVTSDDFKYSFKRILSPSGRSPNTWVLEKISGAKAFMQGRATDISGIEIPDRYTVKIRLEQPFSPFLYLLTMTAAYVLPKEEVERLGADFSFHPVGTGPFLLKEWRHNNEIILARNNHYFTEKARTEGIVYRIIPEELTAVTEFEIGNLDVITVPASEYTLYRNSPGWKEYLSSVHGLNTYYLGFNCSRPPFDNVELRKAVSYAIDREKILKTFYEKRGWLAQGPVPDMLRKWQMRFPYAFDPQKARELIDTEGMKDRTILFYISADQEVVDIAEIIQYYLKAAGLRVEIRQLEWSAYKAAINNGEPDLFWLGWWADYPDPENFLFPLFHSSNHGASGNRSRYTNKEVDRLIEAGQKALDIPERNRYYKLAEEIIDEEVPWVFFWHKTDFTLRQPRLKNYKIYPIYTMDKGLEVSF
ncbi:MAG: ABC transporter substrate-binding protein [Nitrospiraceae bacterium]|nr:MAG: ABC transporter substrate-binding protein [Nitrospiraceae bacterium]